MSMLRTKLLFTLFIYTLSSTNVFAKAVEVQAIAMERTLEQVQAVGNSEAKRSVVLYPAVSDRVTQVLFQPGDKVKKGQLLLELDSRLERAVLNEAQIKLADAERTLKRLQDSLKKGAVAQSEHDIALTDRDLAKVMVAKAKAELEDHQLRAPFDGVMGLTDIEVGDRINEQTAVATIDDMESLFIDFRAPESALSLLRGDGEIQVLPWQGTNSIAAQIAQVDSRIDPQSRTLRVKAKINNEKGLYLPGMSFRVTLKTYGEQYAVVPEAALLWGATGPYVWKSVDKKAVRVDVNIAQRLDGRLLVRGDLSSGELLVTEGVQSLRAGQEITHANDALLSQE